jgi:hypothetical protein
LLELKIVAKYISAQIYSPPNQTKNFMSQEKNPIDNLKEKTFRLLGALQELDEQDPESHEKFGEAMIEQARAMQPFLHQK